VAAHDGLLQSLAVVLGVSAVTSAIARLLRQSVVLGYIVAGLLTGPHVAVPLVADPEVVHALAELGVMMLMFSLGLEFSVKKLLRVGAGVAFTAVMQCTLLLWLGFVVGRLFGWTGPEAIFTGAIIAVSSTTIIAKAFEEQSIGGKLRDIVVGILIVEDVVAVLLLAGFTAFASGVGVSVFALFKTAGRLAIFLVALIAGGMLIVPRAIRFVSRFHSAEATVVTSVAFCFVTSVLAHWLGYSVALGAFIAGSLVAESGEDKLVATLVEPVRDVFAAVFFVSVGMMFDPGLVAQHWPAVVAITAAVVLGKLTTVSLGLFLTGHGTRTSIRAGMSLAQIGEFSFIIAGLGLSLKMTGDFLYPVAVAVSVITTLLTPVLIRVSDPAATWFDRKLPRPLQTFAALYGSWLERLTAARPRSHGAVRRLVRLLVIDASALAAIIVTASLGRESAVAFLVAQGISPQVAWALVAAAIALVALPFAVGIIRVGSRLGTTLADAAFPHVSAKDVDLAAAPRRALIVTLRLALLILVGVPLLTITQPFLRGFQGAKLFIVLLVVLGILFWRSTTNLEGHVRAGAQVIIEALAAQSRPSGAAVVAPVQLGAILEGLGEPVAITIPPDSPAIGKTLAELDLRGLTGATVLAVTRGSEATAIPSASFQLAAGDVLAIAGTREAIASARSLLGA